MDDTLNQRVTADGTALGEEAIGMKFSVLGPLEVSAGGRYTDLGGPKQRAVLGMLLTEPGGLVPTEVLLLGIWGEDASSSSRASLQTYVSNLRALLDIPITRSGDAYRLEIRPVQVDAVRFEAQLAEARTTLTTDPLATSKRLRAALEVWRGLPYADLSDVEGLQREIDRLSESRLSAVELRMEADLASGKHDIVVSEAGALAEEYPLRERFRAQHMLALYRSGRQAEALRAYRRTEELLSEELGIEPSLELQRLELAILEQDESLHPDSSRPTTQRLAFLVTDIEGSTAAWDRDARSMAEALALHDGILTTSIERHGGKIFKHTGDGVLAVFDRPMPAVEAAETAQRALANADWGQVGPLRVRMAIDVGDAESRGGDFYGPPLNRASRLCAAGHGAQVLVSSGVQDALSAEAPAGLQIRQLGEHRLRGFASAERVGQLVFVGLPAEFPDLRVDRDTDVLDERAAGYSIPGYELRDRIGEGAFGIVFRAYQPTVGREVAVKIIRPRLASHPSFIHRFEAEARTIARLAHPRIVPLIDFWRDADGAYLVLQLLPGGSLREVMAGGLDRATARRVLRHVAEALDHAHGQGVVHGDLTPANVLLDDAGNGYLSDFAIAARLLEPEVVASISAAPEFRAPEEIETGPSVEADIYGLGAIAAALIEDPDASGAIARAMAPDPGDRHSSALEFVADLDAALGEEPALSELPVVSRNPFKGLRAFDEGDAADFYGRDELIATLVAALERHRFVTVVGPSGSGKSSAVRAGMLPALAASRDRSPFISVVLTPGSRPFDALLEALESVNPEPGDLAAMVGERGLGAFADHALGDSDAELLVVIDQFEELFTATDEDARRSRFVELLLDAIEPESSRIRIVATLRADFYGKPLAIEGLDRVVRDGLVTVLRPTREELIEMIALPAQAVGLRWEPGLPHRIAQDVSSQPGGLPLLQYTLTEMVERRRGDLLTSSDYERIGGVAGALSARAEAVFSELSARRRVAAREVFLRLVSVDEDTDDTRRRVRRRELESLGIDRANLDAVLAAFTTERLLLTDRDPVTHSPTVEVAHEALLREWPRLREWIEDERESLILGRRFRSAREEWESAGRVDGYLLTGSRLSPFETWSRSAALSADEREFMEASLRKDTEETESVQRRRQRLVGVLVAATIIAVALAGWALSERSRSTAESEQRLMAQQEAETQRFKAESQAAVAREQAALAENNARLARSRELAASAINVLDDDPMLSKLLALAAADMGDLSMESVSALHQAQMTDPSIGVYRWPSGRERPFSMWTDLSPSGELIVASGIDGIPSRYLEVVDVGRGGALWSWEHDQDDLAIDRPRFSADGRHVVAGLLWETRRGDAAPIPAEMLGVRIWDARTGAIVRHLHVGECGGTVQAFQGSVALVRTIPERHETAGCFFPDDTSPHGMSLELVDLETGARTTLTRQARRGRGGASVDGGAAISGDGGVVAYDDLERGVVVIGDAATGETLRDLDIVVEGQDDGFVRRLDESGALMVYGSGPTAIVDTRSGEVLTLIESPALQAHIDLTGDVLSSTGADGVLRGFHVPSGRELFEFPLGTFGPVSASSDGHILVSNSRDAARLVDPEARGEVATVRSCDGFVWAGSLSVGDGVASFLQNCAGDPTGTSHIIGLDDPRLLHSLPGGWGQEQPISPDGSRLLRQAAEGSVLGPVQVHDVRSGDVETELEGICRWERQTGDCDETPSGDPFPFWLTWAEWSSDGVWVSAVGSDPRGITSVVVWDAKTGELVFSNRATDVDDMPYDVIFTPDATSIIVSRTAGTVQTFSIPEGGLLAERSLPGESARELGFVGFDSSGSRLVAVEGLRFGGSEDRILWLDPETLEVVSAVDNPHDAGIKVTAMRHDGEVFATGSDDGVVRVWQTDSRALVHEMPVGAATIQGIAFRNDDHLVITPQGGDLLIMTIDTEELLTIVRDSLVRGFTDLECERYNFEDCPSLEELRAG